MFSYRVKHSHGKSPKLNGGVENLKSSIDRGIFQQAMFDYHPLVI